MSTSTPVIAVRDLTKTSQVGELQVKTLRGVDPIEALRYE